MSDRDHTVEDTLLASEDFDYDKIDGIPSLMEGLPSTVEFQMAGVALHDILEWALRSSGGRGAVEWVPLKIQAAIWVVCPSLFGGCTQSELAERLGFTRQAFSRHIRSFRDEFKFRNHLMRSDETRENNAAAARRQHEGRVA